MEPWRINYQLTGKGIEQESVLLNVVLANRYASNMTHLGCNITRKGVKLEKKAPTKFELEERKDIKKIKERLKQIFSVKLSNHTSYIPWRFRAGP